MKPQTLSEAIISSLDHLGVSYIFGVSGANIEHLHDATEKTYNKNLQSVLCKSEFGAGFIASTYAKYANTIGVCCSTSGGGMMNLVVALAEAKASEIPLLAIIGCPPSSLQGQGAFQDASGGESRVDAVALCQSVSKYVCTLDIYNFWGNLHEAFTQALNGIQGPSVLLVPRDVMSEAISTKPSNWPHSMAEFKKHTTINENLYEKFVSSLSNAQAPILVAGAGLFHDESLINIINQLSIPVCSTLAASGAFPHSNPHFLGIIGVAGHSNVHKALIQSDFIVVIGSQLNIMSRAPIEPWLKEKQVWIINSNINDIPDWPNIHAFSCDIQQFLKKLNNDTRINENNFDNRTYEKTVRYQAPKPANFREEQGLLLQETFSLIQPYVENFSNILMDAGNCAASAAHYLSIPDKAQSYIALGMGGMGYAVAGAIGAQLAKSHGKTMVICGDGAFLITGTEIHTAIELKLPILWIIFNDSQHGMCTSRQRFLFDSRLTTAQYASVNFSLIAKGLAHNNKLWVGRADKYTKLEELLYEYTSLQKPTPGVLEIIMHQNDTPPFFPLIDNVS